MVIRDTNKHYLVQNNGTKLEPTVCNVTIKMKTDQTHKRTLEDIYPKASMRPKIYNIKENCEKKVQTPLIRKKEQTTYKN